ncbi:MAG TPA: DUF4349 domain-containing protein, partial [Gemmataceae bacterium]|nr:DUF4349 domain-containing protein [Gemmataceae bacterium]
EFAAFQGPSDRKAPATEAPRPESAKPALLNQDQKEKAGDAQKAKPADPAPAMSRKIIRSGDIEFEIDSFDAAVATVVKLVDGIKGGFIATINSEKLPNGKVRGSVVVRVPPEQLDALVLGLRKELGKTGELKSQKIGSQDVTKQYTDLESRLRAARAMEERLLAIIKSGKGEIKDLLAAEKELGIWRTRIEEFEGELRYYANLVALSTLTITLYEKEIRAPFAITETERINMGIEVEDVDKSLRAALAAVTEAKGRITKSELKQHAAGQFSAALHFEVAPEAAGPLRDRFKQLGNVSRLEIDRVQQSEGGSGRAAEAKTKRADAQFFVSLYNLTTVLPRETVQLNLACVDAEAVYKTVLARVEKSTGRVVKSNISRQQGEQIRGTVQFEVKSAEAEALLTELKELGEVMRLQTTENPDAQNTTRSKRGFHVELWALATVEPRETTVLHLVTKDVPAGYQSLQQAIIKAKGRILNAKLDEQDRQRISATLDFDVRRTEEPGILAALAAVGDIYSRNVTRATDKETVIDSKVRLQVMLYNQAAIAPRETVVLGIEVNDVEQTALALTALVKESGGRATGPFIAHERSGRVTGKVVLEVPLAAAPALVERIKSVGTVRVQQSSRNEQVPDTSLAMARIEVTLSNFELLVPKDEGVGAEMRKGLSFSLRALSVSLSWLIVGLLVLLPWCLLAYGIYWLVRRTRRRAVVTTPAVS